MCVCVGRSALVTTDCHIRRHMRRRKRPACQLSQHAHTHIHSHCTCTYTQSGDACHIPSFSHTHTRSWRTAHLGGADRLLLRYRSEAKGHPKYHVLSSAVLLASRRSVRAKAGASGHIDRLLSRNPVRIFIKLVQAPCRFVFWLKGMYIITRIMKNPVYTRGQLSHNKNVFISSCTTKNITPTFKGPYVLCHGI